MKPTSTSSFIPLESIRVATPCHASWDNMIGDDQSRFCQTCAKNVFNLSAMSRVEAEALIKEKEGKLCVRYYQRSDGTILTDDCPVGLRIVRRPLKWLATGAAALVASGVAIFGYGVGQGTAKPAVSPNGTPAFSPITLRQVQPFKTVMNWIDPPRTRTMGQMVVMGAPPPPPIMGKMKMVVPPPPPPIMGEAVIPPPPSVGAELNPGNQSAALPCEVKK